MTDRALPFCSFVFAIHGSSLMRCSTFLSCVLLPGIAAAAPNLRHLGDHTGSSRTTEIVVVDAPRDRAFVTGSADGLVEVLSLADPRKPQRLTRFRLALATGDDLTSIAVHPSGEYLLVSIEAREPARGRVEFRATQDGRLLGQVAVGVGPDAVTVSADGRWALVCDEAEEFFFDRRTRRFASLPGSLHVLDLESGPQAVTARPVGLPDLSDVQGVTGEGAGRKLERKVDLDHDGRISASVDLNGDGDVEDRGVVVGSLHGVEVSLDEADGEEIKLPLARATPDLLEPEYSIIGPDNRTAWVVLQENNAVLIVDLVEARVLRSFGLGTSTHSADLSDDGRVDFSATLIAWREPDGIALSPDGRYLLTADEGDTDLRANKTKPGQAAGGGRTLSVFEATTGRLLGDTGNGLDEAAARAGTYPDARSPNKGSEPEMVVSFESRGVAYAAVSLERANAVALVSLADPARPAVIGVTAIDRSVKAGKVAPEGIAHLRSADGTHFIYTANEKAGTVSVFEFLDE